MECSRPIIVKLLLFQSGGCGHLQYGATSSFFPDSKSSILGLSIDVKFVLELFIKDGENIKNIKRGANIYGGPCTCLCKYLLMCVVGMKLEF